VNEVELTILFFFKLYIWEYMNYEVSSNSTSMEYRSTTTHLYLDTPPDRLYRRSVQTTGRPRTRCVTGLWSWGAGAPSGALTAQEFRPKSSHVTNGALRDGNWQQQHPSSSLVFLLLLEADVDRSWPRSPLMISSPSLCPWIFRLRVN
jgi:hypothetical protein